MRRLRIGILDLVAKGPSKALWGKLMNANLASIMPQIVAVWCEEEGHEVHFVCYTGAEDLLRELPKDLDMVFISAFSQAAQLSYALSNLYRQRGAITVLGGPHARCYPQDARKYFDYVTGFCDKAIVKEILQEAAQHQPYGRHLQTTKQPDHLPGVRERWKFLEHTLAKIPISVKIVPMIGSLGCPYTCSFCIDSTVDYQPLGFEQITEDLKFVLTKMKRPRIGWHDPNFGIRFDDYMDAIEAVGAADRIDHIAESSLALLAEPHLKRLQANGFRAILPGIESWYDMNNKSKAGKNRGVEKVRQVADHVNMILRYIPYIQTNFVMGLDSDEGSEPWELTKKFVDLAPGAFPGYSLLTAFGQAAPLNLEYQKVNRVRPFPHHFLNNHHAMNVQPKNYSWIQMYEGILDVTKYTFSYQAIARRFAALKQPIPRWMNVLRAVSSEGWGRIKYYTRIREMLESDIPVRRYFEGETKELPQFYVNRIKKDLGPLWDYLPEGALIHDENAYLNSQAGALVQLGAPTAAAAQA
ncbi:MAG: cobalamin B12-binding domain-containing protein [Gemmatimonadetes bacterium]|nr:cobalamin B12-binding domain-containing protein [Gemmatimonadota bacterium]